MWLGLVCDRIDIEGGKGYLIGDKTAPHCVATIINIYLWRRRSMCYDNIHMWYTWEEYGYICMVWIMIILLRRRRRSRSYSWTNFSDCNRRSYILVVLLYASARVWFPNINHCLPQAISDCEQLVFQIDYNIIMSWKQSGYLSINGDW